MPARCNSSRKIFEDFSWKNVYKESPQILFNRVNETNIRKLTKIGRGSLGLTLPIELVRELGWRERQKIVVKRIKGGVEIRDWRNK